MIKTRLNELQIIVFDEVSSREYFAQRNISWEEIQLTNGIRIEKKTISPCLR